MDDFRLSSRRAVYVTTGWVRGCQNNEIGSMAEFSDAKISGASTGLELDKMEIPSVSSTKKALDSGYRGVHASYNSGKMSSWASKIKVVLLISGALLPLALIVFLWDQGVVDLPYLGSNTVARELERYATVGPVMTSIGKNQHVKLTVQIECKNTKIKNKVNEIGSAIKSRILVILSSSKAKDQLNRHDYDSLKSEFKKEINRLLPKSSIKAVYFANIVRY
jgi:flagellar basal body-associated protein FliL